MTKGQRAMAVAMIYPATSQGKKTSENFSKVASRRYINVARTILQYAPDLAAGVLADTRKAPARSRGQLSQGNLISCRRVRDNERLVPVPTRTGIPRIVGTARQAKRETRASPTALWGVRCYARQSCQAEHS